MLISWLITIFVSPTTATIIIIFITIIILMMLGVFIIYLHRKEKV